MKFHRVQLIHAPQVWEKSAKGKDIVVAVLDTGCDMNHIDLKDRIIGGRNFTKDYEGDPIFILIITDTVLM